MKKRTTISLDEKDMEWLDKTAKLTGRTRSGLIRFLINSLQAQEDETEQAARSDDAEP